VLDLLTIDLRETRIMKKHLFFAIVCLCTVCVAQVTTRISTQDFAKKYKAASSEQQRLQLCIDAINQGAIYRGGRIGNIDQIFGSGYSKNLPAHGKPLERGVVDFGNPLASPSSDTIAAAHTGWYLAFEFDFQGTIQNYYLSNLHK
jgi:hypothetical protein